MLKNLPTVLTRIEAARVVFEIRKKNEVKMNGNKVRVTFRNTKCNTFFFLRGILLDHIFFKKIVSKV